MELCPCLLVEISPAGQVGLQSRQMDDFCGCYCEHIAACNLILDLSLTDGWETTINHTEGGNGERGGNGAREQTIDWNPTSPSSDENTDGDKERPPSIGLAHELIHALHKVRGERAEGRVDGVDREEWETVRQENQIREEQGEPLRKEYSGKPVRNYDTAVGLDVREQYECDCD